jgi:hypothetical protein
MDHCLDPLFRTEPEALRLLGKAPQLDQQFVHLLHPHEERIRRMAERCLAEQFPATLARSLEDSLRRPSLYQERLRKYFRR